MGKNSITGNLTKEDVIADIRMTLSADFELKKCILVVEGDDDIDFFRGKTKENVELLQSYSGKTGVEEIVASFSDKRIIGIRDKDYDEISEDIRMFYYDYCCLEMMLISNATAFSSFFHGYYKGSRQPLSVRNEIIEDLKFLSLFRKLSSEKSWNINFSGLSLNKIIDDSCSKIKMDKLLKEIEKRNSEYSVVDSNHFSEINSRLQEYSTIEALLSITQGHDFMDYFHKLCLIEAGPKWKAPKARDLLVSLICSYRPNEFHETNLYNSICNYEVSNGMSILV